MTLRVDRLVRASLLVLVAILLLVAVRADGALVRTGRIVVEADGGYAPTLLPRKKYAPIRFKGYADIRTTDGGPPPALRSVTLDFDGAGRLDTGGLAVCPPARIESLEPRGARRACARALVGTGTVSAVLVAPGSAGVTLRSPLSIFNGPRLGGRPTVVGHAFTAVPSRQGYAVTVPIERRRGLFGYRARIEVPAFAGGQAVLTHVDARIGRTYRAGGRRRSFVSARCATGVFETRGRFAFEEGTVIEGSVYRGCRVRR